MIEMSDPEKALFKISAMLSKVLVESGLVTAERLAAAIKTCSDQACSNSDEFYILQGFAAGIEMGYDLCRWQPIEKGQRPHVQYSTHPG